MHQLRILGPGTQVGTQTSTFDHEPGAQTHNHRGDNDPGAVGRQEHEAEVVAALEQLRHRVGRPGHAEQFDEGALDDQRQAKGQQQTVEVILTGDPPQQAALYEHAKDADQQRRQHQRDPIIHAQVVKPEHGGEGTEHVLGTMGEVDDPQEPENDRQAQAQQCIERPIDQAQ
ncbi:hypothetical protein D3C80_1619200 [compost metagenome]